MNRATRDKLVSGTVQTELTSGNACWETPPAIYEALNRDFGPFDVDLTADAQRHLCPVWFGPDSNVGAFDALTADWGTAGTNGYSNPPYGRFIQQILEKAKLESLRGFSSTLLLPMRITKAFKEHVLVGASDLLFCSRRITFFEDGIPRIGEERRTKKGKVCKPHGDGAVFDSMIVRYRPGARALNVGLWEVPKHVTAEDLARAVARRAIGDMERIA